MLLSKKLSELTTVDTSWRTNDSSKIIDSLSKIVNIIKDLILLAKQHKIENELFYGNSLHDFYKLLGNQRMMRWLSSSCDDPKTGEEQWLQLIKFIEKDIKVHQQKLIIQNEPTDATKSHQRSGLQASSHTTWTKEPKELARKYDDSICHICGSGVSKEM